MGLSLDISYSREGTSVSHCLRRWKARCFTLESWIERFKEIKVWILPECKNCGCRVIEWAGVFQDNKKGPRHRVLSKNHDEWLCKIVTHGKTISDDTQKRIGTGVVKGSNPDFPYQMRTVRVE